MNTKIKIFVLFAVFLTSSCGPTPKEAEAYNRFLSAKQHELKYAGDSLEEAFKSFDTIIIEQAYVHAKKHAAEFSEMLSRTKSLGDDSSLLIAHQNYLKTYRKVLNNEYRQMFNLYKLPDEEYGLEGEKKFRKLHTQKNHRLKKAYLDLYDAQQKFAERYNLILKKKQK